MILVLFGVLSVMTGVEAGCNYNGCCYCHKYNGHVITHGEYAVDCDIGCKYNFCYMWATTKFHHWNLMLIIQNNYNFFPSDWCRCNNYPRVGYFGECVAKGSGPIIQSVPTNNWFNFYGFITLRQYLFFLQK